MRLLCSRSDNRLDVVVLIAGVLTHMYKTKCGIGRASDATLVYSCVDRLLYRCTENVWHWQGPYGATLLYLVVLLHAGTIYRYCR